VFGLRAGAVPVFCLVCGMERVWMNGTVNSVRHGTQLSATSPLLPPPVANSRRTAAPCPAPHRPATTGVPRTATHRATLPRRPAAPPRHPVSLLAPPRSPAVPAAPCPNAGGPRNRGRAHPGRCLPCSAPSRHTACPKTPSSPSSPETPSSSPSRPWICKLLLCHCSSSSATGVGTTAGSSSAGDGVGGGRR
jgi:hypothetical protein